MYCWPILSTLGMMRPWLSLSCVRTVGVTGTNWVSNLILKYWNWKVVTKRLGGNALPVKPNSALPVRDWPLHLDGREICRKSWLNPICPIVPRPFLS